MGPAREFWRKRSCVSLAAAEDIDPQDNLSPLFFVLNVESVLRHLQTNVQNHPPSSKEASLPLEEGQIYA